MSEQVIPTPRTDAAKVELEDGEGWVRMAVLIEVARELERDLFHARQAALSEGVISGKLRDELTVVRDKLIETADKLLRVSTELERVRGLCREAIAAAEQANDLLKAELQISEKRRQERDAYEMVLEKIAGADYRGNRSPESQLAHNALVKGESK